MEPVGTDLALAKAASRSEALEGETVEFTLTVQNAGSSPVEGVSVADTLPTGLEAVEPLPENGQLPFGTMPADTTIIPFLPSRPGELISSIVKTEAVHLWASAPTASGPITRS